MMQPIYDFITDSAKKRFDYIAFEKKFYLTPLMTDTEWAGISDKILFMILSYLANNDSPQVAAAKIDAELLIMNARIDPKGSIEQLIIDNQMKWEKEITVLKMVIAMLNSRFISEDQIFDLVSQTLV